MPKVTQASNHGTGHDLSGQWNQDARGCLEGSEKRRNKRERIGGRGKWVVDLGIEQLVQERVLHPYNNKI